MLVPVSVTHGLSAKNTAPARLLGKHILREAYRRSLLGDILRLFPAVRLSILPHPYASLMLSSNITLCSGFYTGHSGFTHWYLS